MDEAAGRWAIAVHGGAGRLAAEATRDPARHLTDRGLARALAAGGDALRRGESAVRAAVEAVVVLEDDPRFNAGRGAVLCRDGSVELSAAVMDGRTGAAGGVVGVRRTLNPVRAAEALLDHSHVLLFGRAGDAFASERGLEPADAEELVTPERRAQWERARPDDGPRLDHSADEAEDDGGTVGAVVRDERGALAAATSTGGMVHQWPGRVGDSPVAGAGTWADARCAVSATGTGDAFFQLAFARRLADLIELAGLPAEAAIARALADVEAIDGSGGCILVGASGPPAMGFVSAHLIRGWWQPDEPMMGAIGPDDARPIAAD